METSRILKESIYSLKVVVVGMYPTIFERECLKRFKQADYAIMDESEWVISNLANAIAKNIPLESIKGLIFRKENEIIVNERQNLSENNVDNLPFPARDLLNNDAYKLPTNKKKFTLLNVGRGCSGNCTYCIANIYYGKRFRKRLIGNVIKEIEECVNKYDIKNFLFWEESFTADPQYGESICDEIIKRNLKITWSTTSRVDTLNQILLDKMKKAGCVMLGLGIESYNQNILNDARKGTTIDQIDKAVAMVKKAGINSMGHFIFGLPGDTKETAERSIKFALKNLNFAQFYCAVPYPRTELGKIAKERNWIETDDYAQFDLTKSAMKNEMLTSREIKKIRDSAYRKFYFRPKMFAQAFREIDSLGSFFSTLNFLDWIKGKENKKK
jgi:anaerobic magnesium-protoporphyrin IX monomethyl ester cyclase